MNSGAILSGDSDKFPLLVDQYLAKELSDTPVPYELRIRTGLAMNVWLIYKHFCLYIYNDLFPCVTRKTKSPDRIKLYNNPQLRDSIKEKIHLEEKF